MTVIVVTRLNGPRFGVNPDLLQRVDATPDTVLTLVDDTKYIVAESMDDVIALVNAHRAAVLAHAHRLADAGPADIHSADIHPADVRPADIRPADLGHPAGAGREPSRLRAVPASQGVR